MQAGSECPAVPGNADSMGSQELGQIPAQARSEYDSMSLVRQRKPETFYLNVQSKRWHLEIPLLLTLRPRICLPCGGKPVPLECYTQEPKKECHAFYMSSMLKLSHRTHHEHRRRKQRLEFDRVW